MRKHKYTSERQHSGAVSSSRRRFLITTGAGLLAGPTTLWSGAAQAQEYPSKPMRFVVPFAPGGSGDTIARIVSQKLSESMGQSVIVDNRAGAGGTIAANLVAKARPDGYTLLVGDFGPNVVAGSLYSKLPYDPSKDFAHVILMVTFPFVLTVPASSSLTNLSQLIEQAKSKPGSLRYSSAGVGTSGHLMAEMLNRIAGIQTQHVPYKGGAPAVQALLSGEVDFTIQSVPTSLPLLDAGRGRGLGVSSATTISRLPNLPPISSVLPGFEGLNFHGLHAPAQTPAPIVAKLNQEVTKILHLPDVKKRLGDLTMDASPGTPEEFAVFVTKQIETWTALVRSANIRVE